MAIRLEAVVPDELEVAGVTVAGVLVTVPDVVTEPEMGTAVPPAMPSMKIGVPVVFSTYSGAAEVLVTAVVDPERVVTLPEMGIGVPPEIPATIKGSRV